MLFDLIPLPPFDGYSILEPFLNPVIRMQVDRFRGVTIWIILLAFWYVPFISEAFWDGVYNFSTILGVNWSLIVAGLERFRFREL